jgi:hypothetical protein
MCIITSNCVCEALKRVRSSTYKVNVGRERPGVLPSLFDSGLGNVNGRDFPTLLHQHDRVVSGSSLEVKRTSTARKQRQNVFG